MADTPRPEVIRPEDIRVWDRPSAGVEAGLAAARRPAPLDLDLAFRGLPMPPPIRPLPLPKDDEFAARENFSVNLMFLRTLEHVLTSHGVNERDCERITYQLHTTPELIAITPAEAFKLAEAVRQLRVRGSTDPKPIVRAAVVLCERLGRVQPILRADLQESVRRGAIAAAHSAKFERPAAPDKALPKARSFNWRRALESQRAARLADELDATAL